MVLGGIVSLRFFFERDFDGELSVRFSSNFDPQLRQGEEFEEAQGAEEEFHRVAMQYLDSQTLND